MTDQLRQDVGRLEGKVDLILANQNRSLEELECHDRRLSALECLKARVYGMVAAIGGAVTLFLNLLWKRS
jgi:hypothetical protein